jgi:hypothetical protein
MLPAKPAMHSRFPVRGLVIAAVIGVLSGSARTACAQAASVKPIVAVPARSHGTRPVNKLPYWISRQDCINDDVLTFAIGLDGSFNQYNLEVWAGASDCSQPAARTGSTPTCWKVAAASPDVNFQINVPIRARDIVAHNTPDKPLPIPNAQGVKPGNLADCTSTAISPPQKIILDFMLVTTASNVAQTGHQMYSQTGYDIWGPYPPTNVSAHGGETRLHLDWNKSTSSDTIRYDVYCDPPAGLLVDAGLTPLSVFPSLPGLNLFAVDSGVGGSGGFGGLGTGGFAVNGGAGGTTAGSDAGTTPVTTPGTTCTAGSKLVPGTLLDDTFAQYRCGSVDGLAATSTTVENLVNDVPYTVAVVAVDQVDNAGVLSGQGCDTPIEVTDFYELYRQAGGAGGGGICSIGGPGRQAPALGAVLGGMAAAWLLRRRGRRR